jgi:hypothetical protein
MGQTVESFTAELEGEINRRSDFAKVLRKPDREAFDELMDACRNYAWKSGNATYPIISEPLIMSILLVQHVRIQKLERQLMRHYTTKSVV